MRGKWEPEALIERMCNGEPFTYGGLSEERAADDGGPIRRGNLDADRLIDRTIQKLRRAGKIGFSREGGKVVWRSLAHTEPSQGEK